LTSVISTVFEGGETADA
jgi:hypothetical protein